MCRIFRSNSWCLIIILFFITIMLLSIKPTKKRYYKSLYYPMMSKLPRFNEKEDKNITRGTMKQLQNGAVCSDVGLCSKMGKWILKNHGSAVDAAIATMICNGLLNMGAMGIGGGFLMTIYDRQNEKAYFLNAKDKAPYALNETMFVKKNSSKKGGLSIAVPGEIAGYWEAHQKFGVLPWPDLFRPSLELLCPKGLEWIYLNTSFDWFKDKDINKISGKIRLINLCKTLKAISESGSYSLYHGYLAKMMIQDLNKKGSIMTVDDLKNYNAEWTEPIVTEFNDGNKLYTSNLPGSGGLLTFILNVFDEFKFNCKNLKDTKNIIKTYHRIIETWKYAYAIRSKMGDPDFTNMTKILQNLTSKKFAKFIKNKINDYTTFNDPDHYDAGDGLHEDHGTSHFSILAPNGDAVSVTSSLNGKYGSEIVSEQTGILLNSAIDDFSIPGVINEYGLNDNNRNNKVKGGKRPLSSMVPSIITSPNGDVRMIIGAAGGTQITTSTSLVIARHLWMDETIKEAIDSPRFHHQLYPMAVSIPFNDLSINVVDGLKKLGHDITHTGKSSVCGIVQIDNTVFGCADKKRGGDVY